MSRVDESVIRAIPKAEVHVHLEGGFELADVLELAREAGERPPVAPARVFDVEAYGGGLSAFLTFLDWQCGLVRTREHAARLAYRFAARQSASGIHYTDAIINPTHWGAWDGRVAELFAALAVGFREAEEDGLCVVQLAYSLLRNQSAGEAREIVEWLTAARPDRVVALSVDGDERTTGRTGEKFAEAFTLARDAGFRRTVHAGESSGPEGVWDAVRLLHAERIDHGVRAIDDPALVAHLAETGISLGICPRSNLVLGIYPDLERHPLPALRAAGVRVTVNTDDPGPIGTRLENEWSLVADAYGWGLDDLLDLARASVAASFAPEELRQRLAGVIDETGAALLRRVTESDAPSGTPA